MGVLGIKLVLEIPWTGLGSLAALLLLTRIPRFPAAPIVLGAAAVVGLMTNGLAVHEIGFSPSLPQLVIPTWTEFWRSIEIAVIPQLSLTMTNAVIVTASLSRELFPASASIASERNLALSSVSPTCCSVHSARCRCATAQVDYRPNTALAGEPA
jgi:hypothetical protein